MMGRGRHARRLLLRRGSGAVSVAELPAWPDPRVGLPARRRLREALAQAIDRRPAQSLAVLLLNLDDFHPLNVSLGHDAGDQLLLQLAERLRALLPEHATLEHLGADEFCVALPLANEEMAHRLGRRLVASFNEPFQLDAQRCYSSGSVGYALYPADADSADPLLCRADMALHRAKSEGKGTVRRFAPALAKASGDWLELQALLHEALLAGDQLHLQFQPQFALPDGRVDGLEALLRWQHPRHGEIPPARFIPAAEAGGLIGAIGDWVLAEACRSARRLRDAGWPLRIALNLSAQQLRSGDLPERVREELARCALPAEAIEIELTESSVIEDSDAAMEIIGKLAALGVRTSIDDFGTGFSSLAYLAELPVHAIKVDRSFVQRLEHSERGRKLVDGLIRLAHSLELRVLAEGVESAAQLALLRDYGCDGFQGWLACKAMPIDALLPYLAACDGDTWQAAP